MLSAAVALFFMSITLSAIAQGRDAITDSGITPEVGNVAFLLGHAKGTQGYVCLPSSSGSTSASWTVNNARPEATLFTNVFGQEVQIITHFLSPDAKPNGFAPTPLPFGSPTWQSSFDSSRVWAKVSKTLPAGNDAELCPNSGAIPCLLLQSIGNDEGPTGGKLLSKVTFIQRIKTQGGAAPTTGCVDLSDVGKQALVPYSADYVFFHGHE